MTFADTKKGSLAGMISGKRFTMHYNIFNLMTKEFSTVIAGSPKEAIEQHAGRSSAKIVPHGKDRVSGHSLFKIGGIMYRVEEQDEKSEE